MSSVGREPAQAEARRSRCRAIRVARRRRDERRGSARGGGRARAGERLGQARQRPAGRRVDVGWRPRSQRSRAVRRIQPWPPSGRSRSAASPIGGGAPVAVQTMTKTETANLAATMAQIRTVAEAGADIVRVAVPREQDARGAAEIVARVADPGDRRHPLQPHAGAEGDRRRRALRAPEPGQHRRAREGRAMVVAHAKQTRHAAARRRQLGLAARASARARVSRTPSRRS